MLCLCLQRVPAPGLAPACVQMMEVGTRAFVSYVRGYKEHQLKYIFRIKVAAKEVGCSAQTCRKSPKLDLCCAVLLHTYCHCCSVPVMSALHPCPFTLGPWCPAHHLSLSLLPCPLLPGPEPGAAGNGICAAATSSHARSEEGQGPAGALHAITGGQANNKLHDKSLDCES